MQPKTGKMYATICHVDDVTKDLIRNHFGVTKEAVKKDIEIIREWIRQQPHLPQGIQDDDFLERCLLRNKFRVEPTKEKIEKYYTLRGKHYDTFRSIKHDLPSKYNIAIAALPQLTPTMERVLIIAINPNVNIEDNDVMEFFKYGLCASEMFFHTDYSVGLRIVQDFKGLTLNHIRKFMSFFTAYAAMYQEAYFSRVSGIEYVNAPPFLDIFMQAARVLMTPKAFKRITIHKDLESLHRNVSKDYLPEEFGGTQKAVAEYVEMWDKEFLNNRPYFDAVLAQVSDESARIGQVKDNAIFGANGTFKSLNLD